MMASRRLFRPHSRGDSVDCVNSPLAMRSSRVLACAGVAVARRGAVTRARALRARAEDPPCAHPAPSAVARAFATAWGRARRWTRAGTAEATGAASDIMAAPVLTSRKHSRGVVWSVANPRVASTRVMNLEKALLEIRDPKNRIFNWLSAKLTAQWRVESTRGEPLASSRSFRNARAHRERRHTGRRAGVPDATRYHRVRVGRGVVIQPWGSTWA